MKRTLLSLTIAGALIISCEGPVGPSGLKSLMNTSNEPPGSNCQSGGTKIEVGIDDNGDDILESNEIDDINYVCNGQAGASGNKSIVKVTSETAGTNCSTGGYLLDSGIDMNGNNILDTNEVTSSNYLCNGKDGDGFDKVTILDFGYNSGTTSSNWTIANFDVSLRLYKFNIDNYPGVDSVVFVSFLGTENVNSRCFVDLYNVTDDVPINNSILESNRQLTGTFPDPYELKQTGNIYADLPHKEVTLTYRIKSEVEGVMARAGTGIYLFLYKRK